LRNVEESFSPLFKKAPRSGGHPLRGAFLKSGEKIYDMV
jgi:hypothetical protein